VREVRSGWREPKGVRGWRERASLGGTLEEGKNSFQEIVIWLEKDKKRLKIFFLFGVNRVYKKRI
jgi:hypothetical protein